MKKIGNLYEGSHEVLVDGTKKMTLSNVKIKGEYKDKVGNKYIVLEGTLDNFNVTLLKLKDFLVVDEGLHLFNLDIVDSLDDYRWVSVQETEEDTSVQETEKNTVWFR